MDALHSWCENKLQKNYLSLLVGAILAGAYIGFASQLFTLVTTAELANGIKQLLGGTVFSVGLILVVLGRAELFTGHCLLSYSCFTFKNYVIQTLKIWGLVYLGNFVGSVFLAILYASTGLFNTGGGVIAQRAYQIALTKTQIPFTQAFARGILCNWLVCLAVLLCIYAENNLTRLLVIPGPIATFVALGYEHSVANMYFLSAGAFAQNYLHKSSAPVTLSGIAHNLVPVTLGNIVGGVVMVGLLYWLKERG